ncbi:MAG TPA: PAS domain S-box protein [Candidatus Binatia bacterium]
MQVVPFYRSTHARLILLVLVATVPFIALNLHLAKEERSHYRSAALDQSLSFARLVSSRVDDHISNMESLLHAISAVVSNDLAAIASNDARLTQIQSGLPSYFHSISVLTPDGRMLNSSTASPEERKNIRVTDRKYFKEAVALGLAIGEPVVSRTSENWVLILARSILGPDGSLRAVVSMSTRLTSFQQLLVPERLPAGSVMTLVNEQGIVLARSSEPEKWVGRNFSGSDNFQRAAVEREFSAETVAFDGITRLSSYTTARRAPWIIYVGIPTETALAPTRAAMWRFAALAALTSILALALAWWLSKMTADPLRQLSRDVAQLAFGNLSHRSTVKSSSEVGLLANEFNRMAGELQNERTRLQISEERLRLAAAGARLGTWHWNLSTGELIWSERCREIFGVSADAPVSYDQFLALVHPEDRERLKQLVTGALREKTDFEFEYRIIPGSNTIRWIVALGRGEYDVADNPSRMEGVVLDITERKKAESAILKERDFSEAILDSLPGVFYCYDREFHFRRWNKNLERVTGYTGSEIAGMSPLDFFVGPGRELIQKRIEEVFATGRSQAEAEFIAKNGTRIPYYFTGLTIELDGTPHLLGVGIDLSMRKQAEAERDRLFNLSLDPLCVAGFDGCFKQINPAWTQTLGWPANELLTRPWLDYVHPEDREATQQAGASLLAGQPVLGFENRYRHQNGSYRWLAWNSFPLSEVGLIFSVVRDISERKRTDEELRKSEAELRAAQERAKLGSWEVDLSTRTVSWSAEMFRLLNCDPARGTPPPEQFLEMVHPDDRHLIEDRLTRVVQTGDQFTQEFRSDPSRGPLQYFNAIGQATKNAEGQVVHLVGTIQDITDLMKARRALDSAEREAALGRMAASIAHEINNPLFAIKTRLYTLKKTVADRPETTEKLDLVMGQLDRIGRATRSMLGFFKQRAAHSTSVSYADVIRAATDLFEASFSAKGVRLVVSLPQSLPAVTVSVDELQEVLINLLENERDALKNDNDVYVSAQTNDHQIIISVEDNGPGLGADPEALFAPFYTTKSTGTGLGLTIARRICESYGGKLTAQNRKEGGARFEIVLPLSTKREET